MHLLGLIGYPLGHSFSAGYFSKKFEKEGISDFRYMNFPIPDISGFPDLLKDNPELCGLNVTIPYKEKVMAYLDQVDPVAREIGAVNTVVICEGPEKELVLKGYNTDVAGFLSGMEEIPVRKIKKALVLGTGGASKAVVYALKSLGIMPLLISRHREKGDLCYEDLDEILLAESKLIVNTTPLGTFPNTDNAPEIPYELLDEEHFLYDLVYNPSETLFMKQGREKGAHACNGLKMLVGQAEAAWRIWNNS